MRTDKTVIFNRAWAMPNKWTFQIMPIKKLIGKYLKDGKNWIDPFAGENSPAEITNDLNPDRPTKYHLRASEFAKEIGGGYDGILFDPPYSNRQVKECYEEIGIVFTQKDGQSLFQEEKKLFSDKIKVGGYAICFGWNSNGFGKGLGFELIEVLLVAHGGAHHDTIITVERKFTNKLFNEF